jgi:hypothetical protein
MGGVPARGREALRPAIAVEAIAVEQATSTQMERTRLVTPFLSSLHPTCARTAAEKLACSI